MPKTKRASYRGNDEMNLREYAGNFLKPEDIGSTPVTLTIAAVVDGKFDKPDLAFSDGSKMGLNVTNAKTLAKAWGYETEGWVGKEVKAVVGIIPYKGEKQQTILLTPVSPAMTAIEIAAVKPEEIDIPF
jgi:hypothetical protein